MTDSFLAHVRFSDHVARCGHCSRVRPADSLVHPFCATGRELLASWQRAEELATRQAEEADRAVSDATGDCADWGAEIREAQREAFE